VGRSSGSDPFQTFIELLSNDPRLRNNLQIIFDKFRAEGSFIKDDMNDRIKSKNEERNKICKRS
jgi:hypothetical protein